ncbi:DNA mismatch repair protein MutT [Hahella sp. CCB-MM4]|uniref:NUDIX domain-containing protein n=1 Tax=Hahella sp. (strain CCB-MM4) TaxID=1926491 RepID=UPI000B9B5290|nr:NUDIX hydrolase [Hahella sp. CCB-MM4]OZG71276.1 DNA mismatch repair protein MutT [Hahella sp. CCB-MM4]
MTDSQNPWQTLSSTEVYDNPWIRVEHREVITPTGNRGIYGLIHMKNRAVGIIPIDEQDHTWLVGQYRYATQSYSWEIPMGGVPADEWAQEGARRELREETGLIADELEELLQAHTSNCVTDEQGIVYIARKLTQVGWAPDNTELLSIKRLPVAEAIRMAISGEITDALSLAALLKLAYLRIA